jgi:N6-adenosine-specific RNA methylase IME4/ParB-like chromosome segregation protein Spo0J
MNLEFHALATLFPLLDGAGFDELVADIRTHGLREPIVLFEGKVLDGRNRYRACVEAGVEPTLTVYQGEDPVAYVISLNLRRRHLDESQRAMVAAKLATLKLGDNQHHPKEHPSIEEASRLLNVGHASVERAKMVQRDGASELVQAVERGQVSVSAAADVATLPEQNQRAIVEQGERAILRAAQQIRARKAEIRRAERIVRLVAASNQSAPLLRDRRYPVIYADVPWQHDEGTTDPSRHIGSNHYPVMPQADICVLPVSELATESAVLFLWTTSPHLKKAFEVIEAWGFQYQSSMVWLKDSIGMGYWVRNRHELLLIASRGNMPHPAPSARPDSVIEAPRREHSRKPDEAYELIERMYPELPRIELFARQARPGWDAWGNEVATETAPDDGIARFLRRTSKGEAS